MDLNFETTLTAYEFAHHILNNDAKIAIISMAWLSQDLNISRKSEEPDLDTLSHWVARLEPLIRAEGEGEFIFVIANRGGIEEEAAYAGTSCVLGIEDGEVKVYGILGHEEQELLVVDTSRPAKFLLVEELNAATPEERTVSSPGHLHGPFSSEFYLSEAEGRQESNSSTISTSSSISPLVLRLEEHALQSAPATHFNNSQQDSASSDGNASQNSTNNPTGIIVSAERLAETPNPAARPHSTEW
jgi:hypothetical protein